MTVVALKQEGPTVLYFLHHLASTDVNALKLKLKHRNEDLATHFFMESNLAPFEISLDTPAVHCVIYCVMTHY